MNYTKEIVAGYEFMHKLMILRRRASETVSASTLRSLNYAVEQLEDSLFHVEAVASVSGQLEDCINSSDKYVSALNDKLQGLENKHIDKKMIEHALIGAEETRSMLNDIINPDGGSGYESY